MRQMQEELQAKNEADMQRRLDEQTAIYQAQLKAVVTSAQQSQDYANVAISSLKAKLDSTTESEEESKKAAQRYVE